MIGLTYDLNNGITMSGFFLRDRVPSGLGVRFSSWRNIGLLLGARKFASNSNKTGSPTTFLSRLNCGSLFALRLRRFFADWAGASASASKFRCLLADEQVLSLQELLNELEELWLTVEMPELDRERLSVLGVE